ncbi:anti-sigma factor antagonist [Streptomyces sp. NBC_00557]|uniref:anti-sigma factor antagonist n=1 Tax=Streptomyces sp. NBC_00557 TaxID=2975776 RepID=UPI002E8029C9|nr:anti-sigma factor antagonist [Streptomyces sp. NBC_00557]WUC37290.1 anti-sigma factor antagonist [Streptomyces sp. NBC_00557]
MRLSPQPARSHIRTYRTRGHAVVELRGEIDIVAADEIIPVLDTVTEPAAPSVIVSLLDVDFFDCSGLRLLCRARRRADERGGQLVLVCTHPLTLRILHIVRLTVMFPVYETLDEALDRREASAC